MRRAVIITKHGKERAIFPLLRDRLGMSAEVLHLDTDRFGTFTPEIPRVGSQLDALRAKIAAARQCTPYHAVFVASEGSFTPNPMMPFLTLDRERVALFDPDENLEIIGEAIDVDTNAVHMPIRDDRDIDEALRSARFPSHAVILEVDGAFNKGLRDTKMVHELVRDAWRRKIVPILYSDMRAFYNPTRMDVIARAAADACAKYLTHCPSCLRRGFARVALERGVPCEECNRSTDAVAAEVLRCSGCGHELRRRVAVTVPAGRCDGCNP